jgi:hypothetical protein
MKITQNIIARENASEKELLKSKEERKFKLCLNPNFNSEILTLKFGI